MIPLAFIPGIFWIAVKLAAVMAASYFINKLLSKANKSDAAGLDEFSMPSPQIGRHFPVIFGTPPRDAGLFLLWYGDLYVYDKEDDDVHLCYYYYYSQHYGVCHAGVSGVVQIWYGDVCMWPTFDDPTDYAADAQTAATVGGRGPFYLWGGDKGEGGYSGVTDICYGGSAQAQNSYLAGQLGAGNIGNFRGIVTLVMRNNYWGNSPYPKTVSVMTRANTLLTDGSAQWYAARAAIDTHSLNPAHILRQCLTDTIWGDGRSTALMGDSFQTVADDLYAESFGLNYRYYPSPGGLADFIDQVLLTIDGYIYEDHGTGKFEMGLCRGDYVVGDLDAFDESDFVIERFERPSPGDVPSRITLTYRDRSWPDQRPHAIYDDIALQARQGDKVIEEEIDMPGICSATLANTVVNRLGRAYSKMAAKLRLKCKQTMRGVHWGSVFAISYDDPDLSITQMAVRVVRINYGTIRDNTIEMDVVEDVYATSESVFGSPPSTQWTAPDQTSGQVKYDKVTVTAAFTAALSYELYSVSSPSVSPSASVSASPSSSVSASASEGTPSASISASPSGSISASVSSSASASPSTSVSSSAS